MSMNMDVEPDWALRVAAAVRAEMAWQQRTGVALAEHLGMTQPSVSNRLTGKTPFDLAEIERVAAWLNLSPADLLARAERVAA